MQHNERAHAVLSPSSASRWLTCTPSALLEAAMPSTSSAAADEGTLAHELSELLIRELVHQEEAKAEQLKKIQDSGYFSETMLEYAETYASYVSEVYNEMKLHDSATAIALETRLDLGKYMPNQFGTLDVSIIGSQELRIIDLKYGKGVMVNAERNKQMMIYALGALDYFLPMDYDIKQVSMTIYQPRLDNISTYSISVEELLEFAEKELKPKAAQALKGEGDLVPGEHCKFCKVNATCRALNDLALTLAAEQYKEPNLIDDQGVIEVLNKQALIEMHLKAVKDYAMRRALEGNPLKGFKLVEGRSVRKYSDETEVMRLLQERGLDGLKPPALMGLTELEKHLGKATFKELVEPLLIKPPGAPTLVPESDKRPAINTLEQAAQAFGEDFED